MRLGSVSALLLVAMKAASYMSQVSLFSIGDAIKWLIVLDLR